MPNFNEIGIYLFSKAKNNIIYKDDILSLEDGINILFDYENIKTENKIYTIEIAVVVKEQLYEKSLKYTIKFQFYGIIFNIFYIQIKIRFNILNKF